MSGTIWFAAASASFSAFPETSPPSVPAPAPLVLLVLALGALAIRRI